MPEHFFSLIAATLLASLVSVFGSKIPLISSVKICTTSAGRFLILSLIHVSRYGDPIEIAGFGQQ